MRELRVSITAVVCLMISVGVVMIYSSSGVYALENLGDSAYFLKRQLFFLLVGFVVSFVIMAIDYRILQKYAKPMMIVCLVLLVLVLIPSIGKASFGARRWFKIGPFSFQPSELTKLIIIVYMADFLSRKGKLVQDFFKGFIPMMMVLGVACVLVVKQPDLGNTVLLGAIVLTMMLVAGANLMHLALLIVATLPVLYVLVFRVTYRLNRIIAFLDPWQDSQGVGFQLSQSQIALGSGGWTGVGLGKSVQKLFYLPAAHTDFILSIVGEELGFLGTSFVIVLFIVFIWQGVRIAKRTVNPFGYFLCVGIMAMLSFQAVVNVGVSIGAFPTKGLPLPFISYGGSALVFNMMAVALLLNVSRTEDL